MSAQDTAQFSAGQDTRHSSAFGLLASAEWVLLAMVAAISLAGFVSATLFHQAVDWAGFFPALGASLALVALGAFIRARRNMPRMALGAIGFGVFMAFTASIAIFIFTLFPLTNPLMDQRLLAMDAALGFVWVDFVEFLSNFPITGTALRYIYLSILPQVVAVIILLSYLNRAVDLYRFLAVGILCMMVTVAFWWLYPSVGPAAYGMVSQAAQDRIQLIANAAYGEDMRTFSAQGIEVIAIDKIAGVIAFPSFHMVMTCMVLWFTRGTWVFLPLLAFNSAMPVATVVQGGHHLVDLFGGIGAFALCLWLVTKALPKPKTA